MTSTNPSSSKAPSSKSTAKRKLSAAAAPSTGTGPNYPSGSTSQKTPQSISSAADTAAAATPATTENGSSEPPTKKKRISVACLGCRGRKIKCDGRKPRCLNCELYHDECTFVFHNDKRKPYPKDYIDALKSRISVLESLLTKANVDFDVELPPPPPPKRPAAGDGQDADSSLLPLEKTSSDDYVARLTDRVGQLSTTHLGLRYFGPTSNLHLLSSIIWTRRPNSNIEFKGRAAVEAAGLQYGVDPVKRDHLLNLYWTWHHPFYNITKKSLFLRDMELYDSGRASQAKYYSPVLLNAMLACASLLDDNYSEADGFHLKTRILIDIEVEDPRMTTIQAGAILANFEGVCDRDTRGWTYAGMAIRMALEMGYHLDCSSWVEKNLMSQEEADMRKTTFWGCFVFERLWSLYMGRPGAIRLADVSLLRPSEDEATEDEENEPWVPYVSASTPLASIWTEFTAPARINTTRVYLIKLMEMTGDIQEKLYAVRDTELRPELWSYASDMRVRLTSWYTNLPSPLLCSKNSGKPVVSHVVVLHMQYHATLILLFRPFMRVKQSVTPNHAREICRNAATAITDLLEKYRSSWYTMRRINAIAVHLILTAGTIHLLTAWDDVGAYKADATQGLKICCLALSELGQAYETAKRSLAVLTCLVGKGPANFIPRTPGSGSNSASIGSSPAPGAVNAPFDLNCVSASTQAPDVIQTKWRPEISRTRPFNSTLSFPTTDNLDMTLKYPNNNNLASFPWGGFKNPIEALRESENDAAYADHGDAALKARNHIYDKLMQTTSSALPVPNLDHLFEDVSAPDWNGYLDSVGKGKF